MEVKTRSRGPKKLPDKTACLLDRNLTAKDQQKSLGNTGGGVAPFNCAALLAVKGCRLKSHGKVTFLFDL